jgi:amidase
VALLRQAGFIMLGKTNTPELGAGPFTEPLAFGPCLNPWDLSRTPSGSSGGAAAAVAAGLCPIAQAGDAGGSIRNPAAACGLVGLKPSRGRVSSAPSPNDWLSTAGVLTHTVADTAAALDILSAPLFGDPWPAPPPERAFLAEVGAPTGALRIAFTFAAPYPPVVVAKPVREAVQTTARWLEALGHDVFEQAPDWPGGELNEVFADIGVARYAARAPSPELLEPINRMALERAQNLSLAAYVTATDKMQDFARRLASIFNRCDVALMPTAAVAPPPSGAFQAALAAADPRAAFAELASYFPPPFTRPWNLTGQPAISLPLHTEKTGFPIGVQLVGRPGAEATLLRLAAQLEAAHPWRDRRPALAA